MFIESGQIEIVKKAIVDDFAGAFIINEDILRVNVPVNDSLGS